jgi:hypothetical protein
MEITVKAVRTQAINLKDRMLSWNSLLIIVLTIVANLFFPPPKTSP